MSLRRGIVPTAQLPAKDDAMASEEISAGADAMSRSQGKEVVPVEPWPGWPRQMKWNQHHELHKQAKVCAHAFSLTAEKRSCDCLDTLNH